MMGMSSAIQWWEDSQLRALVLSSAFLHLFLFLTATTRALRIYSWFRLCIWLAYLGSDAAAIYALATLFNRHTAGAAATRTRSTLELLWAPVLLIHLGGPVSISAYNMEDNELWRRHILTLLSQVSVALYVFCKFWPPDGEKLLLWAAVLLFVLGIIKFSVKPLALRSASIHNLTLSRASVVGTRKVFRVFNILSFWWAKFTSHAMYGPKAKGREEILAELDNFDDISIEEYVQEVKRIICVGVEEDARSRSDLDDDLRSAIYSRPELLLLADRLLPYSQRLRALWAFLKLNEYERSYGESEKILYRMFSLLYTKEKVFFSRLGNDMYHPAIALSFAAIGLFAKARKDGYSERLVLRQLEAGWKEYIHDAASFRRFNDRRGQWTLRLSRHLLQGSHGQHVVRRSLQVPFDESVLLWHIATELCFHHPDAAAPHPPPSQESPAAVSRDISSYMAYLLLLRPEMLMPGTRQDLFWSACYHLERIISYDEEPPLDERSLAQGIVHKTRLLPWLFDASAGALLWEASALTEALMQLRDEEERWKLVEGVWVEMLCYSASRCRGYLHAKSLGEGGEFLSHVWLLLSQMGMETFADRFQRPEAPEEHATAAGVGGGGGSTSRPPQPQQEQVPPVLEEITAA
ncbi:unnamed protein product [Urochloa decumbens]|uniref:DUF4220 domain-containing protein n=1 Tax=Urochloa decumbens TaxID=240449 RepID=A0ABC9FY58_9POAL